MKTKKETTNRKVKHFLKFIIKYKKRWAAAGMMLILGLGTILGSRLYQPAALPVAVPEETVADAEAISWTPAETTAAVLETTAAVEAWEPSPGELNLTHYFPEGADQTDMTKSLAGEAFKSLMTHDVDWMSSIYDYSDITPLQMAKRLGRSSQSVMGQYNPKDSSHNKSDSSTWSINSFKNIRMTATDGDGKAITPYSNVREIMSMANLYTYFKGVDNYDLFLSYCKELWEASHSYSVSMSDVYYCSGCMSDDAEKQEMDALEAEAKAEELGLAVEREDGSVEASVTSSSSAAAVSASEASSTSAASGNVIVAGSTSRTEAETEEVTVPQTTAETMPESSAGVIVSQRRTVLNVDETETEPSAEAETTPAATQEETSVSTSASTAASESTSSSEATASDASKAEPTTAADKPKAKTSSVHSDCPGHVDLIIHMKITGLNESKNLFEKDTTANSSKNIEEGGWQGWNQYTKASARLLSSQDWYTKYGLSVSSISSGNPLSPGEIEAYMAELPAGLSETRMNIIRFALSSVGKVPYYWGGKPSAPNYASNSFGILTSPDEKGRVLKGLDCSGWINWVYWSVTGSRLPYESTSGLAVLGTKVARSELQPGDIIVRTGGDAHVIMFLGWTPDGQIRCIHESSASVNNVTVGIRDANWPYYRKLVE